jgi:hypothetical protein
VTCKSELEQVFTRAKGTLAPSKVVNQLPLAAQPCETRVANVVPLQAAGQKQRTATARAAETEHARLLLITRSFNLGVF